MAEAPPPVPARRRMLIAERGTDWLRALRSLSLGHEPFTTLVQAPGDEGFLRERPWEGQAPEEILFLCGHRIDIGLLGARLALFRFIAESDGGAGVVRIVAESDEGRLANAAFLEVVRSLAPGLAVEITTLAALAAEVRVRSAA
ncbi:MAG: hypothetical protein ACK6CU_05020 [Deltaproteobacteria bacterium]